MVTENSEKQTVETQVVTPPVEDIATLKSEMAKLTEELAQTKKGLSTAHQTLTSKDTELKQLRNQTDKLNELEERMELIATELATNSDFNSPDLNEKKHDVRAILNQKKVEQDAKRKAEDYNHQADAVYERAKIVFANDEDKLFSIEDWLLSGKISRAEGVVSKAEAKPSVVATPQPPIESEAERVGKLVQEGVKAELIRRKILIDESGSPSGNVPQKDIEIRKRYAENPYDPAIRHAYIELQHRR